MQETIIQSIVIVTLVFFIFLIVFGLFIYRHFKKEKENERAIFKAVVKAQEEERQTISSNIHDDLGSLLTSSRISISTMLTHPENYNIEELKHLSSIIEEARITAKNASNALTPYAISKNGIKGAIIGLPLVHKNAGIEMDIQYQIDTELDSFLQISIYRIVNEIVNNSVKYSEAKNIRVALKEDAKGKVSIEIADNGKGFNLDTVSETSNGIRNIRNRVKMLNGKINIETAKGKGCRYFIYL